MVAKIPALVWRLRLSRAPCRRGNALSISGQQAKIEWPRKPYPMRRRLDPSEIFVGFIATLLAGLSFSPRTLAGPPYPGATWASVKPEDHNWSSGKLNDAWLYAQAIGSGAVMIVDDGVVVGQWGAVDRKWPCYAIRRGFLSALYGIAVAEGQIDLQKSLDQLGIDDLPPSLSPRKSKPAFWTF